jgi:hypothetical protein
MSIDAHIYVMLTCDDCGHEIGHEEYDEILVEPAQEKAVKENGWQYDGETLLCPECKSTAVENAQC